MRKNKIIAGTLILTGAGLTTRILGFVYRIYMANMMGAEGMGLFQLIMPVYGLAWSIACSGFTTTVSKLTAQERAKAEFGNIKRILFQSVAITTFLGILLSGLLYIFASDISAFVFKDPRTVMPLEIMSIAFPFMAAGSCFRGYFLGLQETLVPGINQVLEQIVRMAVIFSLAGFFLPLGLEYACTLAVIAIICEEAFSLLFILFAYKRSRKKRSIAFDKKPKMGRLASLSLIFSMALPLTANRVTGSVLVTVENILIPGRLQMWGLGRAAAMSLYGQITGMAMPLIYFPTAILTALSTNLVPAVSEARAVKDSRAISVTASKSMLFASILGFGGAAVFIGFSRELGLLIYNQNLSGILIPMGLMCPFIYMQVVLSGLLNGLGHQVFIFKNSLFSSFVNILFIYFLVPVYGTNAFIIGWFISMTMVCGLAIRKLSKSVKLELEYGNWFIKPLAAGAITALLTRLLLNTDFVRGYYSQFALLTFLAMLIGAFVVYCMLIIVTGAISSRDLKRIFKTRKGSGETEGKIVNEDIMVSV